MALFQYPGSAAMSLNNLASLGGSDDDKPKKPALYRAGRAVGTGLNAAHQVAAAGDMAADRAINAGVDATKLRVTNFVRGVQGQPALDANLRALMTALERERARTGVELQNVELQIRQMEQNASLLLEAKKTIAQVSSQLAASSMSAVNFSAGTHSGLSQSFGCSTNFSYSGTVDTSTP